MKSDNSEKSKLLVLCQLFYPELVSTGQTLTELCEELVQLGINVEVICGPQTILNRDKKIPKHMEHKGIHIRRVWGTKFPKLNLMGRVINQITFAVSTFFYLLFKRPKKPILVLTNPPFLGISCAFLKVLKLGAPYIYLIFDVYPDTAVNLGVLKKNGFLSQCWNRFNTFVFRHASAIIVIGRCMHNIVAENMEKHNLDAGCKMHNIHMWCDDEAISSGPNKTDLFIKKWALEGKFVVGYFGNMGRFHDIESMMEAAKSLQDNDEIVFLFVGEGQKKQWAMDYANQHDLSNCQFHTYVEREHLGTLLSSANLGLVSLMHGQEGLSVPSKSFGLMAAGVPIVAIMDKSAEIALIVEEEHCGVVIESDRSNALEKTIRNLRSNSIELKKMGENGKRAIAAKYSLQNAANAYSELISKINRNYS